MMESREARLERKRGTEAWVGVDLDGTLAYYDRFRGIDYIGEPISEMLDRVYALIDSGMKVKIFTARASVPEAIPYIEKWLESVDLGELEITNCKDFLCVEIWDDRARQVIPNEGRFVDELFQEQA